MPTFGENLRREREMRGVTLQEIAAATKISVRFLQALEAEEFSKLPGGVFTRGFIQAYVRYLGLDEERVLAEYQLSAHPKTEVDISRMIAARAEPAREGSRGAILAALLAIVMVAGGYALYRYSRRIPEPARSVSQEFPPSPPATTAPPQAQGTSAAAPPAAGGPTVPEAGGAAASERASRVSAETPGGPAGMEAAAGIAPLETGLVLQVAATERSWVAIDVDGKTALQRVLNPNEIQTLKARESFDITTGNAHGIILTLNGQTLKPLGRRGEVKSVRLTRDDLKRATL